jgi:hypothetical protein
VSSKKNSRLDSLPKNIYKDPTQLLILLERRKERKEICKNIKKKF